MGIGVGDETCDRGRSLEHHMSSPLATYSQTRTCVRTHMRALASTSSSVLLWGRGGLGSCACMSAQKLAQRVLSRSLVTPQLLPSRCREVADGLGRLRLEHAHVARASRRRASNCTSEPKGKTCVTKRPCCICSRTTRKIGMDVWRTRAVWQEEDLLDLTRLSHRTSGVERMVQQSWKWVSSCFPSRGLRDFEHCCLRFPSRKQKPDTCTSTYQQQVSYRQTHRRTERQTGRESQRERDRVTQTELCGEPLALCKTLPSTAAVSALMCSIETRCEQQNSGAKPSHPTTTFLLKID